ncbi:conserved phage C-terminal domain-containing protein [Olsenella sp. An188]|uniref:conserved phage C-terminal domain-containing protein n=1 Tax=Olsenella sp. An188 TaxID=1965579 RepID=UPI000B375975|nr:conserved phage C-terminal domain-containing protein [Olsenella sp. An188]OUP37946.1 hypothetical protein B5F23_08295 [Olsenella sp. An188]
MAVQVLDSLIDGPLQLGNRREGDELIGMIVRYLRTGEEPSPRTDAQRMALAMVRPVLDKSRKRIVAGSEGGSRSASKPSSKQESKRQSKQESKLSSEPRSEEQSTSASKKASDICSSSSLPLPDSPSEEEGCGEEGGGIPYAEIVAALNGAAGTSYRPTSKKTRQLIRARWAEGYRLPDFEAVIDTMARAWLSDPKMSAYLRPETLFGTKFESYLNRPRPRKEARHGDPFAAY